MTNTHLQYKTFSMRTNLNKFQRCPGCGNFMIHLAIKQALQELNIPKNETVVITWIWCSSKMSQYIDWYWCETLHGRGVPFAIWVKLSNPKLTVISYSWDWDTYGIGLWHLLHAARRNINIIHITWDNQNYALTTGQASPTTPLNIKTKSTPEGNTTPPFNPVELVKAAGAKYCVSVPCNDLPALKQAIVDWIKYEWFAHVNVQSVCPSFKKW